MKRWLFFVRQNFSGASHINSDFRHANSFILAEKEAISALKRHLGKANNISANPFGILVLWGPYGTMLCLFPFIMFLNKPQASSSAV